MIFLQNVQHAGLSRNHSRHVGNCMNFVARVMQEMCVKHDISMECKA